MAVSDVRTCPKCGQYQMPACMCALRAANAALKESLTWALNELSFRLGKAWAEKDWEHYGPVVTARALLSPQAAEPPRDDRYDAAHPESEHDGGLGSGDWMGPWEDRR